MLSDVVTDKHIAKVIAAATGIPVENLLKGEAERLLQMEGALEAKVVGQREAVEAVANTIRVSRAGLQSPNRPIGSFMFLGSSGCGKTELCKVLAEFLFDSREALIRIDMSEYMERHSISRLIGAPPGYVGFDDTAGQLTEAVRRRPYSLILLDEIEKAHPEVTNLLLQLLDDGRLTDSHGRVVDFKNCIVVMTSNLGSQILAQLPEGAASSEARDGVMSIVKSAFAPEFLNRIDEIVLFNRLNLAQLNRIVDIQIDELRPLLSDRQLTIELDSSARRYLAEKGFDPVYGARPLKRCIQHEIVQPLSLLLLKGELPPHSHIVVHLDQSQQQLTFQHTVVNPQ
jgi:ATP-dependent Clp protease ATP-binding subunit ClpB